jgi:hypothetical protein
MQPTLPIPAPDYSSPASRIDKLKFVAALMMLPHREPIDDSQGVLHSLFMTTIDDASQWALSTCLRHILKGKLGHGFCPSPSELGILVYEVMQPIRDRQRHERQVAAQLAERKRIEEVHDSQTPAARARIAALVEKFRREQTETREAIRKRTEAAERAEARERNGITPETLAAIPDAPLPKGMRPLGATEAVLQIAGPTADQPVAPAGPSEEQKRSGLDIDERGIVISQALQRQLLGKADGVFNSADTVFRVPDTPIEESLRRLNQRRRQRRKI